MCVRIIYFYTFQTCLHLWLKSVKGCNFVSHKAETFVYRMVLAPTFTIFILLKLPLPSHLFLFLIVVVKRAIWLFDMHSMHSNDVHRHMQMCACAFRPMHKALVENRDTNRVSSL